MPDDDIDGMEEAMRHVADMPKREYVPASGARPVSKPKPVKPPAAPAPAKHVTPSTLASFLGVDD